MLSGELTNELRSILKDEYQLELSEEKTIEIGEFLLSYTETLLSIKKSIKDTYGTEKNDR